jgi:hypothetical protein
MTSTVAKQAHKIKAEMKAKYRELIIASAEGRSGDDDALALMECLPHVGKSVADFDKAVSILSARMVAIQQFEEARDLGPAIRKADAAYELQMKAFQEFKQRQAAELKIAQTELYAFRSEIIRLENEKRSLEGSAADVFRSMRSFPRGIPEMSELIADLV